MEGKAERQTGGGSRYLPMARALAESEANAVHGATAGDTATPRDASRSAMIESGGAANRGGGFDAKVRCGVGCPSPRHVPRLVQFMSTLKDVFLCIGGIHSRFNCFADYISMKQQRLGLQNV